MISRHALLLVFGAILLSGPVFADDWLEFGRDSRKEARYEPGGRGARNYVMATPVFAEGRIYLATGQNPEHYEGEGSLYSIDPTREGDVSVELEAPPGKGKANPNDGVTWRFGGPINKEDVAKVGRDYSFGRTQSNCTVAGGLVYAPELTGFLHCFDARTGKHYWDADLKAPILSSALCVEDRVYVAVENGDLWIFKHGKEKVEPLHGKWEAAVFSTDEEPERRRFGMASEV